jgi:hypothetical protein
MCELQILIRAILSDTSSEVVQTLDLSDWLHDAWPFAFLASLFFIEIIAKMDHVVDSVFTSGVAISIEIATMVFGAGEDA